MVSNKLTMKLSKHLCLECSTCAMFLSSSFTVSIMALFLSKSLSETLIKAPFILLFNLVKMAKMLTYFFKIEMFKAAITGSVEKNHYQHDFCL